MAIIKPSPVKSGCVWPATPARQVATARRRALAPTRTLAPAIWACIGLLRSGPVGWFSRTVASAALIGARQRRRRHLPRSPETGAIRSTLRLRIEGTDGRVSFPPHCEKSISPASTSAAQEPGPAPQPPRPSHRQTQLQDCCSVRVRYQRHSQLQDCCRMGIRYPPKTGAVLDSSLRLRPLCQTGLQREETDDEPKP